MVNASSPPVAAALALLSSRREWTIVGAAVVLGLCAFAFLFHTEIAMAVQVWASSDAYNHCFLVVPVAAYLAWDRRAALVHAPPTPASSLALLALPAAAMWFAADRLGIMEGRQLTAMVLLQVMFLSLIGWRCWRALTAPLLYLFFLVPFGEFLVPPLQNLVVHFTTAGLGLLGVPNLSNGIVIEIPEGTFLIHQACSGLRFLIASAAFGVFYACVIYVSPLRRTLFIVASLAVAISGNCLRVLGTILIAHFIGNNQAVETDHVLWGWLFYVLVGAVLILIGFAFRESPRGTVLVNAPIARRSVSGVSAVALALVLFAAATPRLAAQYLDNDDGTVAGTQIDMPALAGCTRFPVPTGSVPSVGDVVGISRSAEYRCGGDSFLMALYRYPSRIGVRPLFLSLRAAEMPAGANDVMLQTGGFRASHSRSAPVWRVTEAGTEDRRYVAVATALWVAGQPTAGGMTARFDQALNTFRSSAGSPVLAIVTHFESDSPTHAGRVLETFLRRTEPLSPLIRKWIASP